MKVLPTSTSFRFAIHLQYTKSTNSFRLPTHRSSLPRSPRGFTPHHTPSTIMSKSAIVIATVLVTAELSGVAVARNASVAVEQATQAFSCTNRMHPQDWTLIRGVCARKMKFGFHLFFHQLGGDFYSCGSCTLFDAYGDWNDSWGYYTESADVECNYHKNKLNMEQFKTWYRPPSVYRRTT